MIVSILKGRFLTYTDRVTRALGVKQTAELTFEDRSYLCPKFDKTAKPMILVPKNLLKPLPIAANIQDALDVADFNDQARHAVNQIYENARRFRTSVKQSLRNLVRENPSVARGIVSGYRNAPPVQYDYDRDPDDVDALDPIASEVVGQLPEKPGGLSQMQRVEQCVAETIDHLQQALGENRLSDVLYDDEGAPRAEVISQRLIYAIAKIFAKLYDVDASREGNAGPGSVDFRFTVGHDARLLIEVKLSTHERLKDGYYEQLPAYANAEGITRLILLVMRVSSDDSHLNGLMESIKRRALPIQLIVIDAVRKPSASKRHYHEPADGEPPSLT
jgi:hypothetical protein